MHTNGVANGPTANSPSTNLGRKWILPFLLGVFVASCGYYLTGQEAEILPGNVVLKKGQVSSGHNMGPKLPKKSWFSSKRGPTIESMLMAFQEKKREMHTKMEYDYGKGNFERILLNHSTTAIHSPSGGLDGPSKDQMKRKMMIKILEAQAAAKKSRHLRETYQQWSNATETKQYGRRWIQEAAQFDEFAGFPKYVWATGGHSAAAGHGNFWRESYTAVVERAAKDVFAAIGINFIGRNYAMGGTSIAPEVGMCAKEIFGIDVDVLSWDTGMTDGNKYHKMAQYFLRASIQPHQPVLVAIQIGRDPGRVEVIRQMEGLGLAAFLQDDIELKNMIAAIPDTLGLSDEEISLMPQFVRNFRCGEQIENGDPGCKDLKFNMSLCTDRRFRTSWHPGWRVHAMHGNMIALWLTSVLEEALTELASKELGNSFLADLRAEETAVHAAFMSKPEPEATEKIIIPHDVDRALILKGPNFCHTARLPAQIRHLGILTESPMVGEDSYDTGIELKEAKKSERDESRLMQLVYEQEFRKPPCEIPPNKDYKDYFYVRDDGWGHLTLPNDSELSAYGTGEALRGVVVVCFSSCDWGHCPEGSVSNEAFLEGGGLMEVNGLHVSNITELGDGCFFLKNEEGHLWKPDNKGRFQIRAKAENKTYVRLSSFVVF